MKPNLSEIPKLDNGFTLGIRLSVEFAESTPTDILQEIVIVAIFPGLLTIDAKRTVLCSFRAG